MKSSIITIILVCALVSAHAQTPSDTIEVRKNKFVKDGLFLKPKHMIEIMSANPEALKEMQVAKANFDGANVFGFIGGALIGWPLGTLAGGGKPNWALAGAGAGVVLLAVPFDLKYKRHAKAAVSIYNNDVKQKNSARLRFRMGVSPAAASLKITF